MRAKFFRAFLFLLLLSCSESAQYKKISGNSAILIPGGLEIYDVTVIKWKVGATYRDIVSKGIQIIFSFPSLSSSSADDLVNEKGADSWIVQVVQEGERGRRILGNVSFPVMSKGGRGRSSLTSKQTKGGAVSIHYAAASLSTRLESLRCPAFGHKKIISDYVFDKKSGRGGQLLIGPGEDSKLSARVEPFGIKPAVFNGEMTLKATYTLNVALYNSTDQRRKSNFIQIPGEIIIKEEEEVSVTGCEGVTNPPPIDRDIKKFKFGQ